MNRRILMVEDNEDTREIVGAILRHNGYEVIELLTAEEMLAEVSSIDPALIILDVRLPGIDGCQALQKLREAGSRVPVFLFSEYYDLFREQIESCRPDGFYPKSKGPAEMVRAIVAKLGKPVSQ